MNIFKALALGLGLTMVCTGTAQALTTEIPLPMGTVKYDPTKAYNSYVILTAAGAGGTTKLIDRNGNLVKEWDNRGGIGMPNKVYPGGYLLTNIYPRLSTGFQDNNTVAILDWDNKIVRQFNKWQKTGVNDGQPAAEDGSFWAARQHHDYQLEGDPVGYYSPHAKAKLDGKMLILGHSNENKPRINENVLLDDAIYIVDKDGKVAWEWKASDHLVEFGFTQAAMHKLRSQPKLGKELGGVDWFHINCASWLGPNKWYDAGDERFHPENIIADSRNSSHMFIIDHKTGNVVWQVAPPFVGADAKLAPITGIHGTHMIPKGLPGEGNILIFDNGGPLDEDLYSDTQGHAWSRVIEYNPVTKEKIWEYSATSQRKIAPQHGYSFFFSPFVSIAQRLPNGNTLIDEGASCRVFEVTPKGEIVWDYRAPYAFGPNGLGTVYRAYAVPYDYIPQLKKPREVPVTPPQLPLSFMMLPDDEGNVADFKPKLDKADTLQFTDPWVITRPKK